MDLHAVSAVIADDVNAVNQVIVDRLESQIPLINQISQYITSSGGKRLRPLVCLLSARACDYQGQQHCDVAAVVEFLHTATLLHDDVVDESKLRRGKQTANAKWDNAPSVLVGDFLLSRAFHMLVGLGNLRVLEVVSTATNTIAEGEVMQLINCNDPDTDEHRYMDVIRSKTAKMFEAAAQSGAILAAAPSDIEHALARYAMHLGSAFQIIDDILDYTGNADDMGKNIGDDLAEGKPTLPLIHVIKHAPDAQAKIVREAIKHGGLEHLDAIIDAIHSSGALDYSQQVAQREADQATAALNAVPNSRYKTALQQLITLSIHRNH